MAHYIDADKLIAEIERYIKDVKDAEKRFTPNMGFFDAKLSGIYDVMSIVASLQQEQQEEPDKSLEEAAEEFYDNTFDELGGFAETRDGSYDVFFPSKSIRYAFIAGAEWQKKQMLKDAVEGVVHHYASVHYIFTDQKQLSARLKKFAQDEEVKIFIVKAKKEQK